MAIGGPHATSCYAGFGSYVSRGEDRVNDLECHAQCLRERLDRLEAMLPPLLIEASIAMEKGERPPDLRNIADEDNNTMEIIEKNYTRENISKGNCGDTLNCRLCCEKENEIPDQQENANSYCKKSCGLENVISDEDESRVCMVQILAKKEKLLREKIYEMEAREERYIKALADTEENISMVENTNPPIICKTPCPGIKNRTQQNYQQSRVQNICADPVSQRIQELEASSKKISLNLKNLQIERAELKCQAKALTEELRCTQKCLGEVQQRVLQTSSSKIIPIMEDPSLDDLLADVTPCCSKSITRMKRTPQDSEALRVLADQFKQAYKKAELQGLSCDATEPIRNAADRLRALSIVDPTDCPCGQPIKCNSCIVCTCDEWERDLEGGGDDEDGISPENHINARVTSKPKKAGANNCRCGCSDGSSESDCPCGCYEDQDRRYQVCSCSCGQTVETSAFCASDSSTITDTTIPSSDTFEPRYSPMEKINEKSIPNDLGNCYESCCEICKSETPTILTNESTIRNGEVVDDFCDICKRGELTSQRHDLNMCETCPCACTMCASIENEKRSPTCEMCRSLTSQALSPKITTSKDSVVCTCPQFLDAPPAIQKVCNVEKLREGLENLKNRNHAMRNFLNNCGCLTPLDNTGLAPPFSSGEKEIHECPQLQRNPVRNTTSGLIYTVRVLQSKCRAKDEMIVALADELKKGATPEQTSRILECLADPNLCSRANDFDRSELWNYLKSSPDGREVCDLEDFAKDELVACNCPTNVQIPEPPRDLTIRSRVSGDGLIISWLPPISGSVIGYEVLADGEIVSRVRTPTRTEAFVGCLDLSSLVLLEVRTVSKNGLRSATIEKLFNPAQCLI